MSRGRLFLMPNRAGWLGPNLVLNPGFETGGTGSNFNGGAEIDDGASDNFENWTEELVDDPSGNKIEATSISVHAGGSVVAVMITNTTDTPDMYATVVVTPGVRYILSIWTHGDGTVDGQYRLRDSSNSVWITPVTSTGVTGTAYTEVLYSFTAPQACIAMLIVLIGSAAAGIVHFDDVSLKGGY